jgi:hypothetical protein
MKMELNVNVKRVEPVGAESPSHNCQSDNAVAALVETNRQLLEQNRRLTDAVLAICTPRAAQIIEQYELGRLQLQPVPPVPAVPTVSQPEPGVGA